jgi:tRNA pseudouridine55 synthase
MFLLIDKPKGLTSHDVVDEIRRITGEKRVGHAGTLDPNATGLLIVGVGRQSTKKLGDLTTRTSKTYEAEIFLGEERDTDDVEGKILRQIQGSKPSIKSISNLSINKIQDTLNSFIGKQKQFPPAYSAIKVKGKTAYEMARKGKSLNLEQREIEIYSIDLISFIYPFLKITTKVSSGTYIRALARDMGKKLGVGGYLNELRRTQVGVYKVQDAVKLSQLNKQNWLSYSL